MAPRDADLTRLTLLEAGFEEIYRNGFRSARVDRILDRTSVTKGAFYHHFPTKRALGAAIIEEIVWSRVQATFVQPVAGTHDPVPVLMRLVDDLIEGASDEFIACGCPLGSLAQELSPVDEEFRAQIHGVFQRWIDAVGAALGRGRAAGTVAAGVDCGEAALFFVASMEGGIGMMKHARDRSAMQAFAGAMKTWLQTLQP